MVELFLNTVKMNMVYILFDIEKHKKCFLFPPQGNTTDIQIANTYIY